MATAGVDKRILSEDRDSTPGINRREFLYYLLGGSAALIAAGSCGVVAWALAPQFKDNSLVIDPTLIPLFQSDPVEYKFPPAPRVYVGGGLWLSNTSEGLLALNGFCTHLPIVVKWQKLNWRFECPSCGSKYKLDGTYIEGAAKRGLDRFLIYVTTPEGTFHTPPDGSPVSIDRATEIYVDVRYKIPGPPRP